MSRSIRTPSHPYVSTVRTNEPAAFSGSDRNSRMARPASRAPSMKLWSITGTRSGRSPRSAAAILS